MQTNYLIFFFVLSLTPCVLGLSAAEKAVIAARALNTNPALILSNNQTGCNCTETHCKCCDAIPGLSSGLCLDTTWNREKEEIDVYGEIVGIEIGNSIFTKNKTKNCLDIAAGSVCIEAANFSISKTGSCGCWDVDIKFFFGNYKVKVGCFEFGQENDCASSCSKQADCQSCDLQPNCGWCNSTVSCLTGNEKSPYSPGKCASGKK